MRIWLDDTRSMPNDYDVHCRTVEEVIDIIKAGGVTAISIDHDLGPGYTQGAELAEWIADHAHEIQPIEELETPTLSYDGRQKIHAAIRRAISIWYTAATTT